MKMAQRQREQLSKLTLLSQFGCFLVNTTALSLVLLPVPTQFIAHVEENLPKVAVDFAKYHINRTESVLKHLTSIPQSLDECGAWLDLLHNLTSDKGSQEMQERLGDAIKCFDLVQSFGMQVEEDGSLLIEELSQSLRRVFEARDLAEVTQWDVRAQFSSQMQMQISIMKNYIADFAVQVANNDLYSAESNYSEVLTSIDSLRTRCRTLQTFVDKLNRLQEQHLKSRADFSPLPMIHQHIGVLEVLWSARKQWLMFVEQVQEVCLDQVSFDDITHICDKYMNTLHDCVAALSETCFLLHMSSDIHDEIESSTLNKQKSQNSITESKQEDKSNNKVQQNPSNLLSFIISRLFIF